VFDEQEPSAMLLGEQIGAGPMPRRAHLELWDRVFAARRGPLAVTDAG
jgi:hypothetical protein